MKTIALALLAALLGVGVASTEAGAAIQSAGLRRAVALHAAPEPALQSGARMLLVQYGGGDDDDDQPAAPTQRPQQQHRGGGGGVNLNGIINGIGAIMEMTRKQRQQEEL